MASKVKCKCECGNETSVFVNSLRGKNPTISCGCIKRQKAKERTIIRNTTHGMSKHGLYSQYNAMMNRCYRPENNQYQNYGGRGITVCDEWKANFETFAKWAIQNGWESGLTIEKINNNEGYSPNNCRWATLIEQANNRRNNHLATAFGETKTIAQWAKDHRAKAGYTVIYERIHVLQWDAEQAITEPTRNLERSNPSQYSGVSFIASSKKWKAYVTIAGNRVHVGHFNSQEEANIARQEFLQKHDSGEL